jgi:hypothetical protein
MRANQAVIDAQTSSAPAWMRLRGVACSVAARAFSAAASGWRRGG